MVSLGLLLLAVGCTDDKRAMLAAAWDAGTIVCYSGGKEIYRGQSAGKIVRKAQNLWFLRDEATGKRIQVSGDCVIEN